MLGHQHIVVTEKNHAGPRFRAMGKLDPLPNHILSLDVLRMGFSGKHELDGALVIRQDAKEAIRIIQEKVGALVRCKTAREAESQGIRIKIVGSLLDLVRRGSPAGQLTDVAIANIANESLAPIRAKLP